MSNVSVRSIMGATAILRSLMLFVFSTEMPCFIGFQHQSLLRHLCAFLWFHKLAVCP